ncbi:hypothetical protein RAS1_41240 [Phycisphaerae bacterium RAS1]|nr:hypothetical protein RAS1_41240 [Phycisphaerae bacterium RAS1]
MSRYLHRVWCLALPIACVAIAAAQSEIRNQPGGTRLLCIDADGSIRKEPTGPRVLFLDPDGKSIRKEPTGPLILFFDGDSVRENPNGPRIAFLDERSVRRTPTSPVLMDYKHPDICPTANDKREFFVDGPDLTKHQLVGVLYLLKPKLFELSKEETDRLKKEMDTNAKAEEARLAADRAVGKFDILTADGAPASSGTVVVAPKKGESYQVKFSHKGGPEWTGVGVQFVQKDQDRYFWVAFGTPQTVGLGVFDIKGGVLEGKWYNGWSNEDPKNTGMENLKGPESLDGEFTITAAKTPHDGIDYTGTCVIKPFDLSFDNDYKPYTLTWTIGGKPYTGIGLRTRENKLYVAMGSGEALNLGSFKLGTNGEMIGDFFSNKKAKGYYTTSKMPG